MGHRHTFNTAQMFENDNDQSWNHMHPEQPYSHFGIASLTWFSSFASHVAIIFVGSKKYVLTKIKT